MIDDVAWSLLATSHNPVGAAVIPIAWFLAVICTVGLGVTVYNTYDAFLDLTALNTLPPERETGSKRLIARSAIRVQALRAIQLFLFATIALMTVTGVPLDLRRFISLTGLSTIAILLVVNSVNDRYVKRRLLHRIHFDLDEAEHHTPPVR